VKTSPLHEPSLPRSLHTAGVVCFHPACCQPHYRLRQARAPDATLLCVPMCRAPTGHPHHLPSATTPVIARLPWVVQSWLLRTACLRPSLCCHAHIAAAPLSAAQHRDTRGQPLPTRCPRASLLAPPVAHAPSWRRAIPSRACGPPAPLPHGCTLHLVAAAAGRRNHVSPDTCVMTRTAARPTSFAGCYRALSARSCCSTHSRAPTATASPLPCCASTPPEPSHPLSSRALL
jgi:hypothetical protein